jgi:hypothetical protein
MSHDFIARHAIQPRGGFFLPHFMRPASITTHAKWQLSGNLTLLQFSRANRVCNDCEKTFPGIFAFCIALNFIVLVSYKYGKEKY